MEASYLETWRSGELEDRITRANKRLESCDLCPRNCGVNRLEGERGLCGTGTLVEIDGQGPHFGEESVLVGEHGSGTIFVCGCNLRCVFCQNYEISHPAGQICRPLGDRDLGNLMVSLQQQGCHNINIVTPTHVIPQLLSALPHAIENGLRVPLVYNCGGYEKVESLELLAGVIDIYMPDFKFWHSSPAKRYMNAPDYPDFAKAALLEMQRQVGDLEMGSDGLARRGLLVRHLLMPGGREDTAEILRFLAKEVSTACYINLMEQYRPCGRAVTFPELNEDIDNSDRKVAMLVAKEVGLTRFDDKDLGKLFKRLFG